MLIDGKKIAAKILERIKRQIEVCERRKPALALILVGNNPASLSYIQGKKKACLKLGISSSVIELPSSATEEDLLKKIEQLNRDGQVDGILVQMPLAKHIQVERITNSIDPTKDVDGFHPYNMGKLLLGEEGGFIPCTPKGIIALLHEAEIPVEGKHALIVGRSNIVGKPLAALLVQKKLGLNATVTLAHSRSENIEKLTFSADIIVAAIGNAQWLKKEMVKPGAAVIDVGINRSPGGKLVGDVDFEEVAKVAGWITPVPGGVGPMTIAMLMENTWESYQRRI